MVRIALVDDNTLQLELNNDLLKTYLEEVNMQADIYTYTNGMALIEDLKKGRKFDLFILDMMLPDINGIEIASSIRMMGENAAIVFLTATPDYAVQAFDVQAVQYLLKPIDKDKFRRVIIDILKKCVYEQKDNKGLSITTSKGEVLLIPEDIVYVTVRDRRPVFILQSGHGMKQEVCGIALRGSFREAMAPLIRDPRFCECGPSCVVCLSRIESVEDDCVAMKNGDVLYVSRSAATALARRWLAVKR